MTQTSSPATRTFALADDDRPAHLAHVAQLLERSGSFADVHVRGGRILFRGDALDVRTALDEAFQARHGLDLVHHVDRLWSLV